MSYLGHGSRKLEEPPIPTNLGNDVTMVQKKRLAILATMGLGPGATNSSRPLPPSSDVIEPVRGPRPPIQDRKAALLERERQMRDQEGYKCDEETEETWERLAKKGNVSLKPSGPVHAREEAAAALSASAPFFPTSTSTPSRPPKLKVNISMGKVATAVGAQPSHHGICSSCGTSYLPTAKFCAECGAKRPPAPPEDDDSEDDSSEKDREAIRPTPGQWKRPPVQQMQPKRKGKKRKKTKRRDLDDEDAYDEKAEASVSDEETTGPDVHGNTHRFQDAIGRARAQASQSGKIYKNMVVESVKGMVSNDYKGFTDADLQRRFQVPDDKSKGSLMSEEQVKQMMNMERGEKNSVATQRRIQREQAEWQEKLEKHKEMKSGVHSNSRFERTCVGRK